MLHTMPTSQTKSLGIPYAITKITKKARPSQTSQKFLRPTTFFPNLISSRKLPSFIRQDLVKNTRQISILNVKTIKEVKIYIIWGRTFKIRGAYYQYLTASEQQRRDGFVIVSDGNFATSFSIISGLFKGKSAKS
jgi:hypothetical protein